MNTFGRTLTLGALVISLVASCGKPTFDEAAQIYLNELSTADSLYAIDMQRGVKKAKSRLSKVQESAHQGFQRFLRTEKVYTGLITDTSSVAYDTHVLQHLMWFEEAVKMSGNPEHPTLPLHDSTKAYIDPTRVLIRNPHQYRQSHRRVG